MLDKAITQKILDAVRQKPRTIQEIAHLCEKNWRTAERYIEQIVQETGMISSITYREGTRGALRIVYWNALETGRGSAYQESLLQQILRGREKTDFSPFDIYQFVPERNRIATIIENDRKEKNPQSYTKLLEKTDSRILLFCGNLSWLRDEKNIEKMVVAACKRRVHIKILTRIDITNTEQIKRLHAINKQVGFDAIEIRQCAQPLRGAIVDDISINLREFFSYLHVSEVKKDNAIYYQITDPEWIAWTQKVFWKLWNESVDAKTRMDALSTIKNI